MRKILSVFLLCFWLAGTALPSRAEENKRPSVAVVLGGGGARGFAHIAVLELIEEMGIPIDMIAGVSAGAIVGGLYAAGYSPAMIREALGGRDWTAFFLDRPASPFGNRNETLPLALIIGDPSGPIVPAWGRGISSGQKTYEFFKSLTIKVPSYTDFNKLRVPFRAGAVEIPSGTFTLLDSGDLAEAIRASMSVQAVFEPFIIDGKSFVDGGILNNLPIREVREMGYDIVIAADVYSPPAEFVVALPELPELIVTLYTHHISREYYDLADVVLFPLPFQVSSTDFSKGSEVYALARGAREEMRALLEPVREKILAGASGETAGETGLEQAYSGLPPIVPQRMEIRGALSRDRAFIEREFSRRIKGRALDKENLSAFLDLVYETGNYLLVLARADNRSGEDRLEVILYPEEKKKLLVRAGLDYGGTLSSTSSVRAALRSGLEYLGSDGSSLLLKVSVLDELSAGLSLLKPLGPHFFLSAETDLVRDQELITDGILSGTGTAPNRIFFFRGILKGGLRLNRNNSLALWPEYYWFWDEENPETMAGVAAAYTFSNLNHSLFPTRGFRGRLLNNVRITPNDQKPFDLLSVDLAAAFPLGRWFGIGVQAFGSFLFGEPGAPPRISTFNSENIIRIYFPHTAGVFAGEITNAASLSLRFEPQESLSMLGGRLVFLLAVSAGRAGSFEWDSFDKGGIVWNASFGTALIPSKTFGILIRAGAGGGNGSAPCPFVSLDMGMSGFQKTLF
jgi:NTE family protein